MQLDERHVLNYTASHIKGLIDLLKSSGPSKRLELISYFLEMALMEARDGENENREAIKRKLMRD